MASHKEDIASQLLQSTDVRIAEAARRVFSAATVDMTQHRPMTIASSSGIYDETSMYTLGAVVDQMEYNTTSSTPNPLHTTEADQHTTTSNINFEAENDGDDENGKKVSSADRQKRR